jgi:hypothetical protein
MSFTISPTKSLKSTHFFTRLLQDSFRLIISVGLKLKT